MKNPERHFVTYGTVLAGLVLSIVVGLLFWPQLAQGQSKWLQENVTRNYKLIMMKDCWSPCMDMGMSRGRPSMIRHRYFMRNGLPSVYQNKVNPLIQSGKTISQGASLYAENCSSCHGPKGYGDGEGGRDLKPPPANIAHMMGMPMYSDPYLFWTISEGGTPVGSAMPAFKEVLAEEKIWKIIIAMRAGFPAPPKSE